MDNCTSDGNFTNALKKASTLTADIALLNAALNIFLSLTATLGNVLILVALRKVSSIHPATKLLFRCLVVTDLCVGLTTQPLFAIMELSNARVLELIILSYVVKAQNALGFILCGVSIFTSTAISVDRLLALSLGLRYRHVVTLRRIRAFIACFWLTGVAAALMSIFWSYTITMAIASGFIILSMLISFYSYANIFLKMRQHQAQIRQEQLNGGGIPLNIARYKKTVYRIAWVQLALAACYFPYVISLITAELYGCCGISGVIIFNNAATLLFLNSSLNPILYFWKIKEVRKVLKDTVKKFCCSSRQAT